MLWQDSQIPCEHAIAAAQMDNRTTNWLSWIDHAVGPEFLVRNIAAIFNDESLITHVVPVAIPVKLIMDTESRLKKDNFHHHNIRRLRKAQGCQNVPVEDLCSPPTKRKKSDPRNRHKRHERGVRRGNPKQPTKKRTRRAISHPHLPRMNCGYCRYQNTQEHTMAYFQSKHTTPACPYKPCGWINPQGFKSSNFIML